MPPLKPEVARQRLWERGNLNFKLHSGQQKIELAYNAVGKKLFVGNCARRLGKTYWLCKKFIERALTCENPLPRLKMAAATRKDLEEFVIPNFETILADCPPDIRPTWLRSKNKFVFPKNGAEIQLVGLDKEPDGGRGNYCDLYAFEEAGFINDLNYLYGSVVAPMTLRRPGAKIIMLSTPPKTPAHDFQGFCERAQLQKAYIELNIFANPMLTELDIADAKAECIDESQWLREYMCQFIVDKVRAIVPEWTDDFVSEAARPNYFEHLATYDAMDIGVKIDLTALLFAYYDPRYRQLMIEDEAEINGPQMTTRALRDLIKLKESELWQEKPVFRRIADNNNPLLVQDLGSLHGVHFGITSKDELHAMVNELRVFVRDGRLRVSPKCKKLLGCLRYGIWNKQRLKFNRSPLYGHFDHLAALVYLVRNLDQVSDPIPLGPTPNESTMMVRQSRKVVRQENAIRRLVGLMPKLGS